MDLRNRTYAAFVELGRAPAAGELGEEADVRAAWHQLHEAHALVLNPATAEIRMANPFSAVPTAYRVHADGYWVPDRDHFIKFPPRTSIDAVIDRMITILQSAAGASTRPPSAARRKKS